VKNMQLAENKLGHFVTVVFHFQSFTN